MHELHCASLCGRRFYDKAHKLDVLDFFKAQAVHPDAVPDAVFRCIGRTVWADIGEAPAWVTRSLTHSSFCLLRLKHPMSVMWPRRSNLTIDLLWPILIVECIMHLHPTGDDSTVNVTG